MINNKINFKKIIFFFYIIIIILLLFSCQKNDEKITLTFSDWHLNEAHWKKSLKEAMTEFSKLHPNITVILQPVSYTSKETQYSIDIENGEGPDVFHLHAYSVKNFIEKNYVLDLTNFIKKENKNFIKIWYPEAIEIVKKNNHYYAIPGDYMCMVLIYNKILFKEAGLDPDKPPRTWEEFIEYSKKLTRDRNGDGIIDTWAFDLVGAVDPGFELRFSPILFSFGGDYISSDNKRSLFNTQQSLNAIKFIFNLTNKYKIVPIDVNKHNVDDVRKNLANFKIAMKIGSGWSIPIFNTLNKNYKGEEILSAAPIPYSKELDPKYTTTAWLSAWLINKNTKHPKESWELIKFITSKKMEEKWFDDTKVISSRKDVTENYPPLLNDKISKIISSELKKSKFVPQIKEWPQIIELINLASQNVISGTLKPEEAIDETNSKINKILKTK